MIIKDLGLIDYREGLGVQQQYVNEVIKHRDQRFLLVCEHPLVLTLGRLADSSHIRLSESVLSTKKIAVVSTNRGGEVTLHAPGQIVVYPIIDLAQQGKDLHIYLHQLEQVGIDFLRLFDIMGERVSGKTGVWIGEKKIMSIGIGVRKWVSFHGFSVNINTNLNLFDMINPCGMTVTMTSLANEIGHVISMVDAKEKLEVILNNIFGSVYD